MAPFESIDTPAELDNALSLLTHRYRRYVLRYLVENDVPTTVTELAAYIRDQEGDEEGSERSSMDEADVTTVLFHKHLPKFAQADLIAFDSAAQQVVDVSVGEDLQSLLESIESARRE